MRQVRHYRVIRTKSGKRRILINKNNYKKKFKKSVNVNKGDRRILNFISNPNIFKKEYGGDLDFDLKGSLENIKITPGKEDEVWLDPDYEVQFHTHPDVKWDSPPSPEDVVALLINPAQQAEMVIQKGKTFTIIKTHKTKALSNLSTAKLQKMLDEAFYPLLNKKNYVSLWKKKLEELGFIVQINNKPLTPLKISIKPVEWKR